MLEFTLSPRHHWNASFPWGGGHTAATDPTRRGWAMFVISPQVAVFGRRGVKGCFAAFRSSMGFDIHIFDDMDPVEAREAIRLRRSVADEYMLRPDAPGWALYAVEKIESLQR